MGNVRFDPPRMRGDAMPHLVASNALIGMHIAAGT